LQRNQLDNIENDGDSAGVLHTEKPPRTRSTMTDTTEKNHARSNPIQQRQRRSNQILSTQRRRKQQRREQVRLGGWCAPCLDVRGPICQHPRSWPHQTQQHQMARGRRTLTLPHATPSLPVFFTRGAVPPRSSSSEREKVLSPSPTPARKKDGRSWVLRIEGSTQIVNRKFLERFFLAPVDFLGRGPR